MDLKFYYTPMTGATRVHWALEELGVEYEKFKLDLTAGDQRKPEYLALNPNGKVPLLVAEGQPIFESLAILLYLGERFGVEKNLFPGPNPERATAFMWMSWGSVTLGEVLTRLLRNTLDRFPAEERNEKAAETAKKDLHAAIAILERELSGKSFMLGESFSLVDVSLVTNFAFMSRIGGIDLSPYPNINAWMGRCMNRPALARVLAG